MHKIQAAILALSEKQNISKMTLRGIGMFIGVSHPQIIKYHLKQLQRKGFISWDSDNDIIVKVKPGLVEGTDLIRIPVVSNPYNGVKDLLSDVNVTGYLTVSKDLMPSEYTSNLSKIFAYKLESDSLSKSKIKGVAPKIGDYVLVLPTTKISSKDYVLVYINGSSEAKRYLKESSGNICLISESSEFDHPIYLSPAAKKLVCGKIIMVLKKPSIL